MTRAKPKHRPGSTRPRASAVRRKPTRKRSPRGRKTAPRLPLLTARGAALLLGLLCIGGLGALFLPSAPCAAPRMTRLWRGYQTVLVRVGGSVEGAFAGALDRLGPGVVSAGTTTVDFYDFSGMARVRLSDLPRRLDPQDPRRDPYMDRMAGYFTVTTGEADWRAAYIPARSSSLALFLRLRELLGAPGARAWRLVEFDPVEKLLAAASAVGVALILAFSSARRRRGTILLSLLGSIIWIPALLGGGPSILALCLAALFAWLALAHEWLSFVRGEAADASRTIRALVAFGGVSVVGAALFLALTGYSPGNLALSLSPLLCSLVLLASVPPFCAVADAWRRRRVRVPVPRVHPGADPRRGRSLALIVGLFSLATIGLLPLARGGAFPAPIPLFGVRDFSWQAAARLQARGSADRLPDFSDLVAHAAYQQALGLGRRWSFPRRGRAGLPKGIHPRPFHGRHPGPNEDHQGLRLVLARQRDLETRVGKPRGSPGSAGQGGRGGGPGRSRASFTEPALQHHRLLRTSRAAGQGSGARTLDPRQPLALK